jgi:hypothetical protein
MIAGPATTLTEVKYQAQTGAAKILLPVLPAELMWQATQFWQNAHLCSSMCKCEDAQATV